MSGEPPGAVAAGRVLRGRAIRGRARRGRPYASRVRTTKAFLQAVADTADHLNRLGVTDIGQAAIADTIERNITAVSQQLGIKPALGVELFPCRGPRAVDRRDVAELERQTGERRGIGQPPLPPKDNPEMATLIAGFIDSLAEGGGNLHTAVLGLIINSWQAGHIHGEDGCGGCDSRGPGGHDYAKRMAWGRRELPDYVKWFWIPPDKSPLAQTLFTLTGLYGAGIFNTARRGTPNSSGTATLTWQIADGEVPPFEVTTKVVAPGQYGHSEVQQLAITLEITSRLTAWARSGHSPRPPGAGPVRRLETAEWAALLNAIVGTLTSREIVSAIADLADVDPIVVPPPRIVHVVTGEEIARFLPPLPEIPGATGSRGAHLLADPALTLSESADRASQVTRWLCQIAADAGLSGMERLTKTELPAA